MGQLSDNYIYAKRKWREFILSKWQIYFIGMTFVMLTAIFQVLSTRIIGWVIDFFTDKKIPGLLTGADRQSTFYILFFTLLFGRVLLFITRVGWRRTLARQTHFASSHLKEKLWDNVRYFKKGDLIRKYTKGALMNANTSDVASGRFIYGFTLTAVCDVVFLGIFTLVAMLYIHVPLTLITLTILLVIPYFTKKLSKVEISRYKQAQEDLGEFNDLTSQVVSTIRLQRLTQTGEFWLKKMMNSAEGYRQKRLSAVFTSLRYIPLMGGASMFGYVVLFFIGIPFVLDGSLSVGDFVAMQGLIFLLQDPLFELGFIISEFRKSFASLERLSSIYRNQKEDYLLKDSDIHFNYDPSKNLFEVKGLEYIYDDGHEKVLDQLSFQIPKGRRLGVTGPIGSGKSTLINILSGIERTHGGEVYFNGKNFHDYSHEQLRKVISIVGQRPFLFANTIRENVRLDQNLSDDQVWYYLDLAGLKKDVEDFAYGLDTPLGEWGINLSGGQKQRLTLARALARDAQVYLLDDCLSAVDTVTEEKILKNLHENLKEKTLIWVAHRKSTLKYCDEIMELQ